MLPSCTLSNFLMANADNIREGARRRPPPLYLVLTPTVDLITTETAPNVRVVESRHSLIRKQYSNSNKYRVRKKQNLF